RDLRGEHDFLPAFGSAKENSTFLHVCAPVYFLFAAEPVHLRAGPILQVNAGGIIRIQDGKIARSLLLENARLGVRVCLKCAMPVQVVRRNVYYDSNLRAESLD